MGRLYALHGGGARAINGFPTSLRSAGIYGPPLNIRGAYMTFRLDAAFAACLIFGVFVLQGVVAGSLGTCLDPSCFGVR